MSGADSVDAVGPEALPLGVRTNKGGLSSARRRGVGFVVREMDRYFEADLTQHRDRILQMSYLALENLERALNGLYSRDEKLLREAVERDREIDQMEIKIDADCVELLLRLQPVAKDLRLAVMFP